MENLQVRFQDEEPTGPLTREVLILGVETSCDETAAAVVRNGTDVLSNVISSQIDIHRLYGGVVPEIASRRHMETIGYAVDEALCAAGVSPESPDAVAVTAGPGLVGALLVGVAYAKSLSFGWGKPLVGVNHIEGHICANYLRHGAAEPLEPPFLCLVVSGGHTHLVRVNSRVETVVLGRTRDDAAGEAFDKIARALGLTYPGGPAIENLAKTGDPSAFSFPKAKMDGGIYDFSFSGLKSAVLGVINKMSMAGDAVPAADVAASFQKAVVTALTEKAMAAAKETRTKTIALAGGVASNTALRLAMADACRAAGLELRVPPPVFCTDNAAMIASCGYYRFIAGKLSDLSLNAAPDLPLA